MRRAAVVQKKPARHAMRPAYVDQRVRSLGELVGSPRIVCDII